MNCCDVNASGTFSIRKLLTRCLKTEVVVDVVDFVSVVVGLVLITSFAVVVVLFSVAS